MENGINFTGVLNKPATFDELLDLASYYKYMQDIIEILKKPTGVLTVDENPDDDEAEAYDLEDDFKEMFIEMLENKMTEIRNVLNYN